MSEIEIKTGVIKPVECVKEAYELIKSEYWLLFVIWLVGAAIGGVTFAIAAGAMTCGTFYAYLKKIDGQRVSFDDLWKGMQWFVPGLILILLIVVPMIIIYSLIYIPVLIAAGMGTRMSETEVLQMMMGTLAVELVLLLIMVCVHTLLIFSFPLIVDKNLGPFNAMTTSARAVFKNLKGVTGMIGVNFVLVIGGYLALCIGVYFVIPVIIASTVVAYRRVFPAPANPNLHPPPPTAYGDGLN